MTNIKNFTRRKVRSYLSDDGVTPITKDQALQEMLHSARAGSLANEIAISRGYGDIIDVPEEEAKIIMAEARRMTASANDDPYIL